MELSNVKEIITPQGNLKKILRGDVVIWSKKASDLKYTIWKDGELIDRVTMSQFVNKIQNGDAQTDYGIGAQIMIPYTDPFNGVTYDCPFNFGTFTQYPGKLGLQTHYALPSKAVSYGANARQNSTQKYFQCYWKNSYMYNWLNTKGVVSNTNYGSKINGFLSCIPEDFISALQTISFMSTDCKFFLLTNTQSCANTENATRYVTASQPDFEGEVWEYWQNRIGTPQEYYATDTNRIIYSIANQSEAVAITTASVLYRKSYTKNGVHYDPAYYQYGFDKSGKSKNVSADTKNYYQPACVIG